MSKLKKTPVRDAQVAAKKPRNPEQVGVKAVAASALTRVKTTKATKAKTTKVARQVLRDKRTASITRAAAGSVLSQRPGAKKASKAEPTTGAAKLALKPAKKGAKKTVKKSASPAGSALTQHVTTRTLRDGRSVRVVLTPYGGSSLRRDKVESAVSTVLARHNKKK